MEGMWHTFFSIPFPPPSNTDMWVPRVEDAVIEEEERESH